MSSNLDISTSSITDHVGDENATTNSVLSVRIQASKFQRNGCHNDLPSLMNDPKNKAAPVIHTYRSLSNQLRSSPSGNNIPTAQAGNKNIDQFLPFSLKTGDNHNNKHQQKPKNYNGYEMAAKEDENIDAHEQTLENSTTDDDDNQDTEDSADESIKNNNNNDRPKPGRLDLRQFDNITSAIAKLNVQPQYTGPQKRPITSSKVSRTSLWKSNKQNVETPSKSVGSNNVTAFAESVSSNPRQPLTQNARRNHGRPVAPPRLPTGLMVSSSAPSSSSSSSICSPHSSNVKFNRQVSGSGINDPWFKKSSKAVSGDDAAIDFSQSPIALRMLRHSKDHKVSELTSPQESDSDMPVTPARAAPRLYPRAQDLFKAACETSSPSVTIGSYCRTHSAEPGELINTRGETIRQLNEILAKGANSKVSKASLTDESIQFKQSQQQLSDTNQSSKKSEKEYRKDKKRDEKLEKRKLKEVEKLKRQEEEKQRRQEKKLAAKKTNKSINDGEKSVDDDGIPLFIKRCIEFIESEGIDAEGIYRVPGNRAHVDTFVQKFRENPFMSIQESDIPVNAVATALKDFLSKKFGPIIPLNLMNELTELSSLLAKEERASAVRDLVRRLPNTNFRILKYVILHFVKISSNNTLNSMDSKNLAICWWPTLLPLQFTDMVMFEQMRPHLEDSIQTLIDQYDYIFSCDASQY